MKVLVAMQLNDEELKMLKSAAPEWEYEVKDPAKLHREDCVGADIIVGTVSARCLEGLEDLQLLQLDFAGSDNYARLPLFQGEDAPLLTNASGAFGVTISEHMIGGLLYVLRNFAYYGAQQKQHAWDRSRISDLIYGKKALVLGFGDIGSNFAMRMNAMGCSVTAIKRTVVEAPDYVDSIHTMEDLDQLLPEMDFVACCMPNAPGTDKVINEHTIGLMKPGAIVMNVGRGRAIDYDALSAALYSGHLGGAMIDVTDPEPLPEDHPLWEAPGCFITPHVSGLSVQGDPHRRILDIVWRNLKNYHDGLPLENLVDIKLGY